MGPRYCRGTVLFYNLYVCIVCGLWGKLNISPESDWFRLDENRGSVSTHAHTHTPHTMRILM